MLFGVDPVEFVVGHRHGFLLGVIGVAWIYVIGPDIGHLVEGLTKLKKLDLVSREAKQAENLRKLLLAIADDVRVLPAVDGDDAGTVVLNAAFLVTRDAEEGLRTAAADLYQQYTALGMIISFSGPWAPYRFVELYGDA